MTARLYKRIASLELAEHDKTVEPEEGGFFRYVQGTIISDLRITFSIERTIGKEPNSAEITIFNLNENSRALLQVTPLFVRLQAGYDGNLGQLHEGDAAWTQSKRITDGWQSTVQAMSGGRSYQHARFTRSSKAGVGDKALAKSLIESMGLKMPTNLAEATDMIGQFTSGNSINGLSHSALTKVLSKRGYGWSVQDGQMQALKHDEATTAIAVPVSQDTGMIGVPELGQPESAGKPPVLRVRMLLQPEIRPGGRIQMNAAAIKGTYKAMRVLHKGDTHGADWYTEVEAVPQ